MCTGCNIAQCSGCRTVQLWDNWGPGFSHTSVEQCNQNHTSDDCALCSSEHQLRKVRMIPDLGEDCGPSAAGSHHPIDTSPQRGDPLSQSSPFLLVFHLTRTRLNWPLLITVPATFKCLPDPLHYVLKILKFHPLRNQQKLNDSSLISF